MTNPDTASAMAARRAEQPAAVRVIGHRDSFVIEANSRFAGASDRGLRHRTNQDALALAVAESPAGLVYVMTVSDGVSSSDGSDEAASMAAQSACRELASSVAQSTRTEDALTVSMVAAFVSAQTDVVAAAGPDPGDSWACTLICAAAFDKQVVVGNAGDSRCYWFPDKGEPLLLSSDDSVAANHIRLGIRRDIAEAAKSAHAITKWLGPGAHSVAPSVQLHTIDQPGWLIMCSDGLWNYASHPDLLMAVLHAGMPRRARGTIEATKVAAHLTKWANSKGGRDNITVAVLRTPVAEPDE